MCEGEWHRCFGRAVDIALATACALLKHTPNGGIAAPACSLVSWMGNVSLCAKTLAWLAACARGDATGNIYGRRRPILATRFLSLSPQDCCQSTALHCRLPDHVRSGGDPHSLDSKGRVSWRWGSRHLFASSVGVPGRGCGGVRAGSRAPAYMDLARNPGVWPH